MKKSKTKTHAEREIDILLETTPDAVIKDFAPEILAICEAFGNSGQSGCSAPYTAIALSQAIKKLCLQETIAPLTGEDDEWNEVGEGVFQNNRLSSVLKKGKDGRAYYLYAISWKTQKDITWTGNAETKNGETITSRQYIKSFPFQPSEFSIDVIEEEIQKDDWVFHIKDENDLKRVWEVYDIYENPNLLGESK